MCVIFFLSQADNNKKILTKDKTQFHFSKILFSLYFQFYTCQAKAIIKNPTYSSLFIYITIQFHPCWHSLCCFRDGSCIYWVLLDKNNPLFLRFIIGTRCSLLSFLKSCLMCNVLWGPNLNLKATNLVIFKNLTWK